MERKAGLDTHIEVTKTDEGTIVLEGFTVKEALSMRRRFERVFDATVVLEIVCEDETKISIRGASNEPLGDDETADGFRMWISGWFEGRRPERAQRGGMARP